MSVWTQTPWSTQVRLRPHSDQRVITAQKAIETLWPPNYRNDNERKGSSIHNAQWRRCWTQWCIRPWGPLDGMCRKDTPDRPAYREPSPLPLKLLVFDRDSSGDSLGRACRSILAKFVSLRVPSFLWIYLTTSLHLLLNPFINALLRALAVRLRRPRRIFVCYLFPRMDIFI